MDFLVLLQEYVLEQALVVAVALWVLGFLLKKSSVKDKYIIWVLLVVGIVLVIGLLGLNVDAVIQGILVTGLAILGHQIVRQTTKDE